MAGRLGAAFVLLVLTGSVLSWTAPNPAASLTAMRNPNDWVGTHGADAAILTVAVAMCWLALSWLALGLAIGLAGQLPGVGGRCARALGAVVLPRAIRQAVALTLGVGLVTAGASTATADPGPARPGDAASSTGAAVDWPVQPSAGPSPPAVSPPAHGEPPSSGNPVNAVVLVESGDSLWAIAAERLGPGATSGEIAAAVAAWYQANHDVIGPDPDLIHPGQRLAPPPPRTP